MKVTVTMLLILVSTMKKSKDQFGEYVRVGVTESHMISSTTFNNATFSQEYI